MNRLPMISLLFLFGCNHLQVSHLSPRPIDPGSREFVLLKDTDWEPRLRIELMNKNFKLKKFTTNSEKKYTERTIVDKDRGEVKVTTGNQMAARYGIQLTETNDYSHDVCLWNGHTYSSFSLELTDIDANEVLMVISNAGWTGDCDFSKGDVFEKMINVLDEEWKKYGFVERGAASTAKP